MSRSFLGLVATRVLSLLFILLAGLLPGTAVAQKVYLSGALSTLGSGFNMPDSVAMDASDNIYVADYGNSVVKEMLASGEYATIITLGGGFNGPEGVAVDGNGNVFVGDTSNGAVKEIPASCISGANNASCVITLGGGFSGPAAVAVDGNGNVFVADYFSNAVKEIPSSCIYGTNDASCVLTLGSGFNEPSGVAVDGSGDVFVADDVNHKVKEIPLSCIAGSNDSTCVLTVGSGFNYPYGVAVDGGGNVFVADLSSVVDGGEVNEIVAGTGGAPAGTVNSSSTVSTLGGGFNGPAGVAVDGNDNVFIADTHNNAIKEFSTASANFGSVSVKSPSTTATLFFTFNSGATLGAAPIAVLTQGITSLDFSDAGSDTCTAGTAYIAGATCTVNVTFTPLHPGPRYGAVELVDGSGKTLTTGFVQGTGTGPQAIFANSTSSSYLPSAQTALGSGLIYPWDIAVDAGGNIFIADEGAAAVKEIMAAGGYVTVNTLTGGFNALEGIAIDGAGNVFVTDAGKGTVSEILAASGYTTINTLAVANGNFNHPGGLAVDGSGNVFVADTVNNQVKEILAAGGFTTVNTLASGNFEYPEGLALDGNGNVFVADTLDSAVKEILAAGGYTTVNTLFSGFYQGIVNATNVAVDASGNLFVANSSENNVKKVLAAGGYTTVETLGTGFNEPYGLAVDGSGNVIIANVGTKTVMRLDFSDAPSLNFAPTLLGATSSDSPQTLTIANDGNLPLTIDSITYPSDFKAPSGGIGICSTSLNAGADCNLIVEFTPLGLGSLDEPLAVTDNSLNPVTPPYATQTINLIGAAIPSVPTQLAFGVPPAAGVAPNGNAGSAITVQEEDLHGNLITELTDTITLTVTAANGYTQTYAATASGGIATFNLSGVVLTEGVYTYTASLTGLASAVTTETVAGTASTDPATSIGSSSTTQTAAFYITSSFTLGSIAELTQGAPNLDFQGATGGTCTVGATYATGQFCTVNYSFDPKHPGPRYGAIVLFDNSSPANAMATVYLQGIGNGPQIIFSSAAMQNLLASGFGAPKGLAVDGSGDVFVADYTHNVVDEIVTRIFVDQGQSSTIITINPVGGGFYGPQDVAVDGSGNVFVADTVNGAIKEIPTSCIAGANDSSCVLTLATGLGAPEGLAVDGGGNVFVADTSNDAVKEIVAASGYTTVNTLATGFNQPEGVAVDGSGNVFVADTFNNAVKEILAAGGYTTVNTLAAANGNFSYPIGVALDGSGNIFVGDFGTAEVKEILTAGGYTTVNIIGSGFVQPDGIAVDGGGNVFVADAASAVVQKLDVSDPPSLTFASTVAGTLSSDSPQTVTISNDGNQALNISAISYGNPFTEAQGVTGECTASTSLALDATCTLPIDFLPVTKSANDLYNGGISLTDNNLNGNVPPVSVQTISLAGMASWPVTQLVFGVPPASVVGPGGNAGSLVTVDEETASDTVFTYATDSITLTVTGPNSYSHTYAANAANGVATFNLGAVALTQGGTYTYTASFTALSNAVASETVIGVAYTDPATSVGTPSATQTASFYMTSSFTLGSIAALTQGASNLDFQTAAGGTCTVGTSYTSGQICSVNYTFNPRHPGTRHGALVLYDSSVPAKAVMTAYLQGIGNGSQVIFSSNNIQSVLGTGFTDPRSVAIDGNGNVFVADSTINSVKEIVAGTGGAAAGTVNSSSTVNIIGSGFNGPWGLAVDGGGNVIVADSANNAVKEILAAGGYTTVKTLGSGFNSPTGVALDGSGNVFVADLGHSAVKQILAAGGYVTVNTVGSGFSVPEGVAVDGFGNVFASNVGNNTVQEIVAGTGGAAAGTVNSNSTVDTLAVANGNFASPEDVAVDGSGNVFVADSINSAVKEILAAGGYTTVKTLGSGFAYLGGITVDGNGNVYVADSGHTSVKELDYADSPSLSFVATPPGFTSSDSPLTVTISNNGNQALNFSAVSYGTDFPEAADAVTDCSPSTPLAYDASCTLTVDFTPSSLGSLAESLTLTDNSLNSPQSISVSGTGVGPVTQLAFGLLPASIISAGGNAGSVTVQEESSAGFVNTAAADSITLTVTGPNGYLRIYTATAVGGIAAFDLSGATLTDTGSYTYTASFTGLSSAVATESVLPATLLKSPTTNIGTPSATQTATLNLTLNSTLGSIAVLTQGAPNLDFKAAAGGTCQVGAAYISGQSCTVNFIFNPTHPGQRYGAVVLYDNASPANVAATLYLQGAGIGPQVIFSSNNIQTALGSGFSTPVGLAVDASGNVFIADSAHGAIKEILEGTGGAAAGAVNSNSTVNTLAVANGHFIQPYGVAVDGGGNLFVADPGNGLVKEVLAAGGYTTVNTLAVTNGHFAQPIGVAVDGGGDVFITDAGLGIVKEIVAASDYFTVNTLAAANGHFTEPVGVAVDGNDNVFVADPVANTVKQILASNSYTVVNTLAAANGHFLDPYYVAVDGTGNVFVADFGNSAVKEILAAGGYVTVNTVGSGLSVPIGVAVDASGNVFVNEYGATATTKLDFIDPPALSFTSTNAGSTSSDSPKTVVLSNNGNAALTFPIPTSGNDPSITTNFTFNSGASGSCPIVTSTSSAATLAAGASCNLAISFVPAAGGSLSGALALTDDNLNQSGPNYTSQSITLQGTGLGAPVVSLSATSRSFGKQLVGATSPSQSVTLTNTGNLTLSITSIAVTGADASSFIFANSCGASLAAGASCSIHGHFTPTATGALSAAVAITDNASGSPQSIALSGTGVTAPEASLDSTSISFGNQAVETTSPSQAVTLTNTGGTSLSITSIAVTGANATSFVFANSCGASLAAGASCSIHGHFTPTTTGALSATVTVTDNSSGSPQSISLSGTGESQVSLSSAILSYGNQLLGTTSASQSVTLTNIGGTTLSIASIAVTGINPSSFVFASSCRASLAAGASCTIHGHFTPTTTGTLTAAVTVTDNASGPPQSIALSGTGESQVSLSSASLSFGNLAMGITSASQSVTLTNIGATPLSFSSIAVTGADPSSFVFANSCGARLAAGAACTIHGHFTPATTGALSAAVTITDIASGSPQAITLSGTGQ